MRFLHNAIITMCALCGLLVFTAAVAAPHLAPIVEESARVPVASFIVPNERDPQLFQPILKDKTGVLISVGTFRTLHDAANGNFDVVLMLDYDKRVTAFNRLNLELIAASANRHEYMSRLLGRTGDLELIAEARAGQIADSNFVNEMNEETVAPRSDLPLLERSLQNVLLEARLTRLDAGSASLAEHLASIVSTPERWNHTIWGSDEVFERVKTMIARGAFHVATGSLSGTHSLADAAKQFRKAGLKVTAVDLSNALDYVVGSGGAPAVAQFEKNLSALPLSDDAVVLLTIVGDYFFSDSDPGRLQPDWIYLGTNASRFLDAARSGRLTKLSWYYSYAREMAGMSEKLPPHCEELLRTVRRG